MTPREHLQIQKQTTKSMQHGASKRRIAQTPLNEEITVIRFGYKNRKFLEQP